MRKQNSAPMNYSNAGGGTYIFCIVSELWEMYEKRKLPVDFNEKLFHRLVDYATVYPDGRAVFTFHNGVEVSTEI